MSQQHSNRSLLLYGGATVLLSVLLSSVSAGLRATTGPIGPSGPVGPSGSNGEDGLSYPFSDVILEEDYRDPFVINDSSVYAASLVDDGYIGIDSIEDFLNIGVDSAFPNDESYVLLNDLDFNNHTWVQPAESIFKGTFDGAGYTISNVTSDGGTTFGMFNILGDPDNQLYTYIKNLTLEGFDIQTTQLAGALAAESFFYVELQHITVKDSYIQSEESRVGGFIGDSNLVNVFYGEVSNTIISSPANGAGGFFGEADSALFEFSHSLNNQVYGFSDVGGFIGYSRGFSIYESSNQSIVIAKADYVGGFAGRNDTDKGTILKWSYNTGTIISYAFNETAYAGGLVGSIFNGSYGHVIIEGVANVGDIYGAGSRIGGLFGQLDSDQFFLNHAVNAGNVTLAEGISSTDTGGIVGNLSNTDSFYFYNVYNRGDVTGHSNVGGLFGYSSGGDEKGDYRNAYNSGTVTGHLDIGGLFGEINGGEQNYMTNVFNIGDVVPLSEENDGRPAEIVGRFNDNLMIHNVYFYWDGVSPYPFGLNPFSSRGNIFIARPITDMTRFNTYDNFVFKDIWNFDTRWTFTNDEYSFPVLQNEPTTRSEQTTPDLVDLSVFNIPDLD
jgi:hypothetical protein